MNEKTMDYICKVTSSTFHSNIVIEKKLLP